MHEQYKHMMHALMHWEEFNDTLETNNWLGHRVLVKNPNLKIPNFKNPTKLTN